MALLGRDNSEDLNYLQETQPLVSSLSDGNILEATVLKDIIPALGPIPTSSVDPIPFSEVMEMNKPQCVTHLNTLNDDVEKLFSMPEKFDIAALSSGSDLVTFDRNEMRPEPSVMEKPFLDDEMDYSGHRQSRFPHQHHPLKSMRNRSFKTVRKSEEQKPKKKKKKKKHKIKTPKSFPSRSALLSPTIVEVENEEYSVEGSSSSSDDGSEVGYTMIDTGMGSTSPANSDAYMNGKPQINGVKGQQDGNESEPNDFKLDLDEDIPDSTHTPAIILTSPSPVSSDSSPLHISVSAANSQTLMPNSRSQTMSPVSVQSADSSSLTKLWPSNEDKVGFYIGDSESISSHKSTPHKQVFYVGDEKSQKSDTVSIDSIDSESTISNFSREPETASWKHILSNAEPVLSQSASKEGSKGIGNGETSKVKFHMGGDDDSVEKVTFKMGGMDISTPKPRVKFMLGGEDTITEPKVTSKIDKNNSKSKVKFLMDGENNNTISKVKFLMGADSYSNLEGEGKEEDGQSTEHVPLTRRGSKSSSKSHKHRHHHHHEHYRQEDLLLRRHKGSEVHLDQKLRRVPTEQDEASLLHKADLDEMASHRLEDIPGIRRHKINRKKRNAMASIVHIGKADKIKKKFTDYKKYDHSPHEVFVELDELYVGESKEYEWREKARWIKFEEDVEEGAERWGKPHVASLSFHSLLELRRGLENGTILLDLEATDLPSIINYIIDSMIIHDQIKAENKGNILRTLLLKHKHQTKHSLIKSLSSASFRSGSQTSLHNNHSLLNINDPAKEKLLENGNGNERRGTLEFVKVDVDNNMQSDGVHIGISPQESIPQESRQKNMQDIMRRIPPGAEAITVLVGCVDYLPKPAVAFVRLAEGQILDNLTEVPLPVRFLFLLLGPENSGMDYHEVGRSISTLMSNQHFHDVAYRAESRAELLTAINEFLDESIVLPPGDWDQKTLLPIMDMARKRAKVKRKQKQRVEEKQALLEKEKKQKVPSDPLKRTRRPFGGFINDIKRRYPHYLSDFQDGLNLKCLAACIFIFFACVAPCIAFGGLLSEKTHDYLGVKETVISTSICGVVFALLAGQPLMLVGATGPVLVFEQSLYMFCTKNSIEFLTMRVWIGFWVMLISIAAVAAESSFLVRYISRFTEEIFAILISLIFIFEVIKKIDETFHLHPLVPENCAISDIKNISKNATETDPLVVVLDVARTVGYTLSNDTNILEEIADHKKYIEHEIVNQPNTALMSTILTLGTFLIAYFLRIFRNSKFLGRQARRALGDFGIVISIIMMVLVDLFIGDRVYTQKLSVPGTFEPTAPYKRGWFVNPAGSAERIETYIIFASIIPAFLIFMLLYLETQITEMLLNKKELKLKKGSGYHLDMVLVGSMTFFCSLFGLPWMCPATVRTIAHVSALSVMSTHHAPGEKPKLMHVKEQRVTSVVMNTMIGVSLFLEPVLKAVPMAVLFGVFLYLGISALSGVQMYKRIKLLFVPVKHHPSRGFVRRVKTMKMHLFTIIQVVLLILLLVIKSTAAALAFPLFVILLVPLRMRILPKFFTEKELHELDQEEEDSDDDYEDDPDFYQLAHMPV